MDGWMDRLMSEWMDRWIVVQMGGCFECMDGWVDV